MRNSRCLLNAGEGAGGGNVTGGDVWNEWQLVK